MIKRLIAYYIPLTLLINLLVTIERVIMLGDGTTMISFYGMPWGYISSAYACTWCYDVFLFPLALNLLVTLIAICFLSLIVRKFIFKYYAHRWTMLFGFVISIACVVLFLINVVDGIFHLRPYAFYELLKQDFYFGTYP